MATSEKILRIEEAIGSLECLECAVSGDTIDNPTQLATKITSLCCALEALIESGKGMDEVSLFPVPRELLNILDGEISNPELYRLSTFKDAEKKCTDVANRIYNLQSIKSNAQSELPVSTSQIPSKSSKKKKTSS